MEQLQIKNQLDELLENSISFQSLDALQRGAMKEKMGKMSEKQMLQMIEKLKDEKEKQSAQMKEIHDLSTKAKHEARTLHSLYLMQKREKEQVESNESSKEILKQIDKTPTKVDEKKNDWLPGVLILAGLAALAYYFLVIKH